MTSRFWKKAVVWAAIAIGCFTWWEIMGSNLHGMTNTEKLNNVVSITIEDSGSSTIGTGWFLTGSNGEIVTAYHVIGGDISGAPIMITLYDGEKAEAEVVKTDQVNDLALLKLKTKIKNVPIGLKVCEAVQETGTPIVVIGMPLHFTWSMTSGVISNNNRTKNNTQALQEVNYPGIFIQVSPVTLPGYSGGPVITDSGCVAGIADFLYFQAIEPMVVETLSFAVRSDSINAFLAKK